MIFGGFWVRPVGGTLANLTIFTQKRSIIHADVSLHTCRGLLGGSTYFSARYCWARFARGAEGATPPARIPPLSNLSLTWTLRGGFYSALLGGNTLERCIVYGRRPYHDIARRLPIRRPCTSNSSGKGDSAESVLIQPIHRTLPHP